MAGIATLLKPNVGWLVLLAALTLSVIGIAAIDVATPDRAVLTAMSDAASAEGLSFEPRLEYEHKQTLFLFVALGAMLLTASPHHRLIGQAAYPLLLGMLLLLVLVVLPSMPASIVTVRGGARRWFNLGSLTFQPSELAKIIYVLALARYLRFRENYRTLSGLLAPLLITFVPMGLILIEPDLGTAMVFLPVLFAMLLAAGAKIRHLLTIILIGLVLTPALYPLLRPYQKDRIKAMFAQARGDTRLREDIGFQAYKAQTLVGAGEVAGNESLRARNLVRYNRLPEARNDMIFAVVGARWGLLGGLTVLGGYLLFIAGSLLASAGTKDPFARLVAVGISAIIFTQVVVNVGMTIGLLPVTGLSLPFISYGGSSLVTNFLMVGLILNITARRTYTVARPAFEFDSRDMS